MALSKKEVEHIAALARLELSAQELDQFRVQLSAILDHMRQLSQVDTSSVTPKDASLDENRLRADEVSPPLPLPEVLGNARHTRDGQFRVPGIFKDTDA